ncbi:MAG: UDP-N-acetylglucosamine 1-carboxyvinyltransferase [Lachnospiraceae bacterium]|nr:UDP-N-acetylglucosamine 1-carboxyvinyltransferase [Lachnospiraceae bacterium]
MSVIRIEGGRELHGHIRIQGSKNAALPILAATVLVPGTTVLSNCPDIRDVDLMKKLLESMGCRIQSCRGRMEIDASGISQCHLQKEYIEGMRSSIILLGAILARFGKACIGYPGGCVIGERPINYHLMALRELGADVSIEEDQILASASCLIGKEITFPISSVGATENALLAAVSAKGVTVLKNAATEPEITALCRFLIAEGADIEGLGTRTIKITGGPLHEVHYQIPPDRIVAGTYLLTVAAAGGRVSFEDIPLQELTGLTDCLRTMGIELQCQNDAVEIISSAKYRAIPYLATEEYPGFATDLQPQMAAALTCAEGNSIIEERIFDNRFGYAKQLEKMGASVMHEGRRLLIRGTKKLHGADIEAADLRGGAALILAGLMADGVTYVKGCRYVERGYEDIVRDLSAVGARIKYAD